MTIALKPLDQQVIVVTGASEGVGLATAQAAIDRGARVVVVLRAAGDGDALVARADGTGRVVGVVADAADRQQVKLVTRAALERFGRIDTWINLASMPLQGRIDEIPDADNRQLFERNFWSIVNGSLAALRYLKVRGGALINVGDVEPASIVPRTGMHTASTQAMKGFTDALRVELESDGAPVSVTIVQPTLVGALHQEDARGMTRSPDPHADRAAVADAILHAATHPERDIQVAQSAPAAPVAARAAPLSSGWMERKLVDRQQLSITAREAGIIRRSGGAQRMPSVLR